MKYQRIQPSLPFGGFLVSPFSSSETKSHSQATSSSGSPSHGSSHNSWISMSMRHFLLDQQRHESTARNPLHHTEPALSVKKATAVRLPAAPRFAQNGEA